jgi:hypothetical protein
MTDYPMIIKYFYKNPSFHNYIKLRHYIDPKLKSKKYKNKIHYSLFLYIIHLNYPSFEEDYIDSFFSRVKICFSKSKLKYVYQEDCSGIHRHIMGDPTLLCMTDIDMLWLCFYATGDTIYSEQVKKCALTKKQSFISDAIVKTAAEWSYNNHVLENYISGTILEQNSTMSSSIIDPLFYSPNQASIMEKYRDE